MARSAYIHRMLTDYPTPLATWEPEPWVPRTSGRARVAGDSAWRYAANRVPRRVVVLAALVSGLLHVAILFGAKLLPHRPVVAPKAEEETLIRLVLPDLKELEDPEPVTNDDREVSADLPIPVPMQADRPSLPTPNDFVQQLNLTTLLEAPDLSRTNLAVIPEHYISGTRIADRIGKIFNLEDLDRHPEPVLQPAPTYPHSLRREGLSATVLVEFIVDPDGRVLEPVVTHSDHSAFNDAALTGVSRWKFRAGLKGGRKVYVRMRVPIVFKVADLIE